MIRWSDSKTTGWFLISTPQNPQNAIWIGSVPVFDHDDHDDHDHRWIMIRWSDSKTTGWFLISTPQNPQNTTPRTLFGSVLYQHPPIPPVFKSVWTVFDMMIIMIMIIAGSWSGDRIQKQLADSWSAPHKTPRTLFGSVLYLSWFDSKTWWSWWSWSSLDHDPVIGFKNNWLILDQHPTIPPERYPHERYLIRWSIRKQVLYQHPRKPPERYLNRLYPFLIMMIMMIMIIAGSWSGDRI